MLPVPERRELVRQINTTLPYSGLSEDDPNFAEELQRRIEAIKSGEEALIDHETVMQLMRARIDRASQQ